MNPNDIVIDPEIRELIPSLREEERTLLEDSLRTEGCRDPLVVWADHGILLDGHNRWEICERLGIEFRVTEILHPNRDAACDWVDANQLGRRNLTPDQMALLRGRRYNRQKKSASFEKGKSWNGNPGGKANAVGDHFDHPQKTAESLARQHGVSAPTIRRDGQYAEAVEKVAAVAPDLPSRIAYGTAPARKAVVDAAVVAESDPETARKILAQITIHPAHSVSIDTPGQAQSDGSQKKPEKKFDTGPRYLAILMGVFRELSRIQRINLSDAEKADFRQKVMDCLEDQLRRTK